LQHIGNDASSLIVIGSEKSIEVAMALQHVHDLKDIAKIAEENDITPEWE
jgi:hypothetical protein